jgi:hypothetical protein
VLEVLVFLSEEFFYVADAVAPFVTDVPAYNPGFAVYNPKLEDNESSGTKYYFF